MVEPTVQPIVNQHYVGANIPASYDTTSEQSYRQRLAETTQALLTSEKTYHDTVTAHNEAHHTSQYEDSYKNELNSINDFRSETVKYNGFTPSTSEIPLSGNIFIWNIQRNYL